MGVIKYSLVGVLVALSVYIGALLSSGPTCPLACTLVPAPISDFFHLCYKPHIEGWADKKFEPVRDAFRSNFEEYYEGGAQLTVYAKGTKVVDLWGKIPETVSNYSNYSLQRVFSSGKMVEVLAVAICVDRGLFSLDDAIAKYWPEFAKHGKDQVTIAQLMRHESGLSELGATVTLVELEAYTRGDATLLARIIEDSRPAWPNTTRRVYHALSRGWVLSELIRRVDPKHRLFHEFVREEISDVLEIDMYFLPEAKATLIHPLQKMPPAWFMVNVLIPYFLGELPFVPKIDHETKTILATALAKPSLLAGAAQVFKHGDLDLADPENYNQFYNYSLGSSFGGVATGSALAAIAAVCAGHGYYAPKNIRLFKEETWQLGSTCPEEVLDAGFNLPSQFTDFGYSCSADGWNGWDGWGGSQVRWREKDGMAFGYAMTRMGYQHHYDPRYLSITAALNGINT